MWWGANLLGDFNCALNKAHKDIRHVHGHHLTQKLEPMSLD